MDALSSDRVARALLGEVSAKRQLVVDHGPVVLGLCLILGGDDPEGAFRAIWREVFRGLSTWDRKLPLALWLATMAHRHFVNLHGSSARGMVVPFGERRADDGGTGEVIDATAIRAHLPRLSPERRRALVMHHLAELRPGLIATTEGAAPAAIEGDIHHARAHLARQLRGAGAPWEELSRLHAGHLHADERQALRARIATEPALGTAWADMQALCGSLDQLARPAVPAPLLDELAPVPPSAMVPAVSFFPWMVALFATVAAVGLSLRPDPVTVGTLGPGVHELDGRARLSAGGSVVQLDGHAQIDLDAERVRVRVLEGSAQITDSTGNVLSIAEGQERAAAVAAPPP